jgi:hypothetical protein
MKKSLLVFCLFVISTLFFSSCEPSEVTLKKEKISEEKMLEAVSFVNEFRNIEKVVVDSKNPQLNLVKPGIGWRLGRKSRGCKGFGICGRVKNGIEPFDDTDLITPVSELQRLGFIKLEIADFSSKLEKLPIVIDSDIAFDLDGQQKVVKSGSYPFDASIGEKGGYSIAIQ